jgi:cytidyltransferase-like protein
MKVGLVHGRFQPFHKGHKWLIDRMIAECDISIVLVGSYGKKDKRNPYKATDRLEKIRNHYGHSVYIGMNLDLSPDSDGWDVLLSSCCLNLCGEFPTTVYAGPDYSIAWRDSVNVVKADHRYAGISATIVRDRIGNGLSVDEYLP